MDDDGNLTGVWHGLYTYPDHPHLPESHYVCVMLDHGGHLSGSIHENMYHYRGPSTEERADLTGVREASGIRFLKSYNGHGTQNHSVFYEGALNEAHDEIEGSWTVYGRHGSFSGRFLMIRKRAPGVSRTVEVFEKA